MAAAASSSSHPNTIRVPNSEVFDVFISFRGKDTRNNFTSHVHGALRSRQIKAFIDSKDLRCGDEISGALLKAIEESKLYVVIFSPDYASSTWCLRELEKILQCRKQHKKQVIPVFHKVKPTDIRSQTGSFGEGFNKVKENAKVEQVQVQRWKASLKEAADLSGRHQDEHKSEYDFINELAEFISRELYRMLPSTHDNSNFLVGIDPHVEKVISSLCLASPEVRSVGLWGMGGVGKTTIAEAVFVRVRAQFQSSHFFRNVREELNQFGEIAFWNRVLSEILEEKKSLNLSLSDKVVITRLHRKRVFIVFDDVESSGILKLEGLLHHHRLFGAGSKILVTCRDIHVLAMLRVDETREVVGLKMDDALKLFSQEAFLNECPADGFMELSRGVVDYAEGNPLALKVLGSALISQNKKYWESELKKMKSFLNKDIFDVLRLSFDRLDDGEKEIFLDIACLFQGQEKNEAMESLKFSCSSVYYDSAYSSITNLRNKSLLTISGHNTLGVHHLLQEMSWKIEREQPKRRRLQIPVDMCHLLRNSEAAQEMQSVIIDLSAAKDVSAIDFAASVEMLNRMVNLRVLKVYGINEEFPEHAMHLVSNTLRYIHWEMSQKTSLPTTFDCPAIVKLSLSNGNIEQPHWRQELVNLRWLDLKNCHLVESPDLSKAWCIEYLNLTKCRSLLKLHPSTQHLRKLEVLNLAWCENLKIIPDRFDSEVLRVLNLLNCENIQGCPEVLGKLGRLSLYGRGIRELPQCSGFESLRELTLAYCSNVTKFPAFCTNLERLHLYDTGITEVPSSVEFLIKLDYLYLGYNKSLSSISINIWTLKSLKTLHLIRQLGSTPEIMEVHGSGLREFHVSNMSSIKSLPEGMCYLKSLCTLEISSCGELPSIPELPHSLEVLDVASCPKLETITISKLSKLKSVRFPNCYRLDAESRQQIMRHAYSRIHQVSLPAEIVLPGSDMPSWFHHTSEGASVTVRRLSINLNPLIGIAFCINIRKPGTIGFVRIKYICRANTKDGQNNQLKLRSVVVTSLNCGLGSPDDSIARKYPQNHTALWYLADRPTMESIHKVFSSNYSEATFEFHAESGEGGEVTNCGVYLKFDEKSYEDYTDKGREEHLSAEEEEFYSCDEDF